jgi:hypothetical protein
MVRPAVSLRFERRPTMSSIELRRKLRNFPSAKLAGRIAS